MKTHLPFSRLTGPTLTIVAADCRRLAKQAHSQYQKYDEEEPFWLNEAWEFSQLAEAAEAALKSRKLVTKRPASTTTSKGSDL